MLTGIERVDCEDALNHYRDEIRRVFHHGAGGARMATPEQLDDINRFLALGLIDVYSGSGDRFRADFKAVLADVLGDDVTRKLTAKDIAAIVDHADEWYQPEYGAQWTDAGYHARSAWKSI